MTASYHTNCLICGSRHLRPLYPYQAIRLVQCGSCRFTFSGIIPSHQELESLYSGYGRDDYLSPVTIKRFHEILNRLEKFRKTNRMLDVGCGIGYFLEAAKERGWNVYGTEFTDEAVTICRNKGIQMQQGKLNAANYDPGSFDIIVSIEVIEHINNPSEEVEQFRRLLRPGGAVYLTTPNFNSLSRRILQSKWNVLSYPEHLCYYTPGTINELFKRHGFRRLRIDTSGISISRLKSGIKSTPEKSVSPESDDEAIRRTLESSRILLWLKSAANKVLSLMKAGDSIKATFVKR
jgi:SAM-dependent methyltransferase